MIMSHKLYTGKLFKDEPFSDDFRGIKVNLSA